MSRIPLSSVANGVLFATEPFASPSNPAGVPVLTPAAGVSYEIFAHGTTTPSVVWNDEFGGTAEATPYVTDAQGNLKGWIDPATLPLDLEVILDTGATTYVLTGGGGSVTIEAADATIVVGGTQSSPTVKVAPGTFDTAGAATTAISAQKGASGGLASLTGTVLTASQVPPAVVIGSGHPFVSTVTSSPAAYLADIAAQAHALLTVGTPYTWSAVNPSTGALLDFGSGVTA